MPSMQLILCEFSQKWTVTGTLQIQRCALARHLQMDFKNWQCFSRGVSDNASFLPHHPSGPGTRTAAIHGKRSSYYIYTHPTDSWVITSCCRPKNFCFNWTLIRCVARRSFENKSHLPDVLSAATSRPKLPVSGTGRKKGLVRALWLAD